MHTDQHYPTLLVGISPLDRREDPEDSGHGFWPNDPTLTLQWNQRSNDSQNIKSGICHIESSSSDSWLNAEGATQGQSFSSSLPCPGHGVSENQGSCQHCPASTVQCPKPNHQGLVMVFSRRPGSPRAIFHLGLSYSETLEAWSQHHR